MNIISFLSILIDVGVAFVWGLTVTMYHCSEISLCWFIFNVIGIILSFTENFMLLIIQILNGVCILFKMCDSSEVSLNGLKTVNVNSNC